MTANLPAYILMVPFLAVFGCVILGSVAREWAWRVAVGAMALTAALALAGARAVLHNGAILYDLGGWPAPYGIQWMLDGTAALGTSMIAIVALLTLCGTRQSVKRELPGREVYFYTCALLMLTGLLGMTMTFDLFNMFVHLEVAALSAYALVAAGGKGASRAAFQYLIMGSIGASLYLIGVALLYAATGTLNMGDVAARLGDAHPRLAMLSLAFIAVGLGIKMGLFPFHGWMPSAYSKTSIASSSLMAPLTTKVSAFAFLRIVIEVYHPAMLPGPELMLKLLCWFGAVAMIAGPLVALLQRNLMRVLVYSSISQTGLVMLGIGLANQNGYTGAMLHIVNDALMKGVLFLAAGVALHQYGVRTVDELARLRGRAPWLCASFLVAGVSLVGLPPLCGFFGKWYVLAGAMESGEYGLAAAVLLGSIATGLYVFKILEKLYFVPAGEAGEPGPRSGGMLTACTVLALFVILFGLSSGQVVMGLILPGLGVL